MKKSLAIFPTALVFACGEAAPVFHEDANGPRPPHTLHFIVDGDDVRVQFSRSFDDAVGDSRVAAYEVCAGASCERTERNYLDLPADFDPETPVAVHSVGLDGALGAASDPAVLYEDLTIDARTGVVRGDAFGALSDLPGAATARQAIAGDGGPLPQCYVQPPARVYAPVYGPFSVLGAGAANNQTNGPWSFWQHRTGFHRAGGGVQGADDTFAWDVNINVAGAGSNLDVGQIVLAMGYGTVRNWGNSEPGTDGVNSILIDHCGWWTGYLHNTVVYARTNDAVSPWTVVSTIGRRGADNDHLHAVTYSRDAQGRLISYNAAFVQNAATIAFVNPPASVRVGQTVALSAQGNRTNTASGAAGAALNLNAAAQVKMTWWKSSNSAVLSVDGSGRLTGRAPGVATITLYWSGASRAVNISVVR
jgi:hypothetical protein